MMEMSAAAKLRINLYKNLLTTIKNLLLPDYWDIPQVNNSFLWFLKQESPSIISIEINFNAYYKNEITFKLSLIFNR